MFFKINFFKTFFQKYHESVKSLVLDQAQRLVGPDLGPNALQMLSAEDTIKQIVKFAVPFPVTCTFNILMIHVWTGL